MSKPQSGVLPDGSPAALFLTLNLFNAPDAGARVRQALGQIVQVTEELAARHPRGGLLSVVAVGAESWSKIFGGEKPPGLHSFVALENSGRAAPATPCDLFVHIRSKGPDLNFLLAKQALAAFGDAVRLVEEVSGFRYLDNRDLTGFVDGTENPAGEDRARVALVEGGDPRFAEGSYIHIQRYEHNLPQWEQLPVAEQEAIIGRTKADDVEMDDDTKPPTAHISRVDIKEDGNKVEILRHSMPYGDTTRAGLYFVSYGATPEAFEKMLAQMIVADEAGHYDHLMNHTLAVTGAAFFAPPRGFLVEG